jgi:hypothetical protein
MGYTQRSVVKILNQTYFHVGRMVRVKVQLSISVRGFFADCGGRCRLFPDEQTSRKTIALSDSISVVNWMDGLKLLR